MLWVFSAFLCDSALLVCFIESKELRTVHVYVCLWVCACVCVCVLRRKLVEQLHLLSQTLERTCPNRRTHTHVPPFTLLDSKHTHNSWFQTAEERRQKRRDETTLERRNVQRQLNGLNQHHVHQCESGEDLQPAGTRRQKSRAVFQRSVTHTRSFIYY